MVFIRNIRLTKYNYQDNGYYFVTIITNYRKPLLAGKEVIINKELEDLTEKVKGLTVDYFVIMPDHIHIIFVLENCSIQLGEIVRRLKAKVSHELGQPVWQPNYYEHVIRNEKALNMIREYIIHNPEKELLKFDKFYN